ncbi:UPF0175 family protein [Methanoculleus chikugoensis]|uniref:UPF0175 family protein n=1 Tax=Methanoculleus chikugoensis TaxID=118126 RepID=UPI000AE5F89B|nr:UPF0175 family protein [Methanoculleus chikugoensis]
MTDITITVPPRTSSRRSGSLPTPLPPNCSGSLLWRSTSGGILSSGKAAALAEMTRWEWEELLGARKIPRHYADENLDRDIAYAARS